MSGGYFVLALVAISLVLKAISGFVVVPYITDVMTYDILFCAWGSDSLCSANTRRCISEIYEPYFSLFDLYSIHGGGACSATYRYARFQSIDFDDIRNIVLCSRSPAYHESDKRD